MAISLQDSYGISSLFHSMSLSQGFFLFAFSIILSFFANALIFISGFLQYFLGFNVMPRRVIDIRNSLKHKTTSKPKPHNTKMRLKTRVALRDYDC